MSEQDTPKRKRGQRGPNKIPALVHVSVRISREAHEFYKTYPKPTQVMREALEEFAKNNLDNV